MRLVLALFVSVVVVDNAFADEAPAASGSESLGGQLLDDLPGSAPAPSDQREVTTQQPGDQPVDLAAPPDPEIRFHPLRFDDVGAQENAAQPSGPLLLVRAGQNMVQAESLLRKQATIADASKAQDRVVAQLDELIKELSKQCNCSGGKPGDNSPSPSQRSQAKPGKSGGKAGRGSSPARDSNAQLTGNADEAEEESPRDLDEIVKRLWGHLPRREREQMLQQFSDEFLPKYELEIEQYYQRLSEESDGSSP